MKRGLEGHLPGDYSVVQKQGDEENDGGQESQKAVLREGRNDSARAKSI